jgi:hypothetical protein
LSGKFVENTPRGLMFSGPKVPTLPFYRFWRSTEGLDDDFLVVRISISLSAMSMLFFREPSLPFRPQNMLNS